MGVAVGALLVAMVGCREDSRLSGPVTPETGGPTAVVVRDTGLRAAMQAALTHPDTALDTALDSATVLGISQLDASGRGIRWLDGIESLRKLQALDLSHNEVADVAPLGSLNQLRLLILTANSIANILPLGGLPLAVLVLDGNPLADLSPLEGVATLESLSLRGMALDEAARSLVLDLRDWGVQVDTDVEQPPDSSAGPPAEPGIEWPAEAWLSFLGPREDSVGGQGIWVMTAEDDEPLLLDHPECGVWSFGWSPDGRTVAFVCSRSYDILLLEMESGVVTDLEGPAGTFMGSYPTWSPDGARIACPDDRGLGVIEVATGEVTVMELPQRPAAMPAWSPDGSRIAYVHLRSSSLVVVDVATGETSHVADGPDFGRPTWSPSCEAIAFTSHGNRHLEVVDVDGSGQRRLMEAPFVADPAWSPDGCCMAYVAATERVGTTDIWMVDSAASAPPRRLTDGTARRSYPQWVARPQ